SLRSCAQTLDDRGLVVERRQDDERRRSANADERAEDVEAGGLREDQIEEHDVGARARDRRDGLRAVGGGADDLDAAAQRQEVLDALADELLILDEEDADHDAPSASGRTAVSEKPRPGEVSTVSAPPRCSNRSRMPDSPPPTRTSSAPRPSSRARISTPAS